MKRGTPRHPKMYAFAAALNIPLPYAVGILEMLWHHTAQHTPRGDIGSLPDVAIAEACSFRKPKLLIDALVSAKWLEVHPEYRLIIHDWPQHCEASVRKWLDRNSKEMLPVYDKCLDIEKTNVEQCPPSREATAMAKAKASVVLPRKKEKTEVYPGQLADFEQFWHGYWRKVARSIALGSFCNHVISKDRFGLVITAIQMQMPAMLARPMEARPHATTWLNQHRWEDDPAAYAPRQQSGIEAGMEYLRS